MKNVFAVTGGIFLYKLKHAYQWYCLSVKEAI